MTKEDKKLLFRYLSMALPYNVYLKLNIFDDSSVDCKLTAIDTDGDISVDVPADVAYNIIDAKPYLRPLASMTEEERTEINALIKQNSPSPCGKINLQGMDNLLYSVVVSSGFLIDWMLNKHFDIFGLIPKELAIAVTEENNPYKIEEG